LKNEFFTPIHINAIFHSEGNGEFATRCIILIFGEFDNYPRKIDNGMFGKKVRGLPQPVVINISKAVDDFSESACRPALVGMMRHISSRQGSYSPETDIPGDFEVAFPVLFHGLGETLYFLP